MRRAARARSEIAIETALSAENFGKEKGETFAMEYYFQMKGVTVGYDRKPLIRDIDINIRKGEIVTMIGPNGAGKSTIIRSIIRQLSLIGGDVILDGENMRSISFRELSTRMAVVLTEHMKPDLMTCYEVAASGRYPYTGRMGILSAEDERRVEDALRLVRAESFGNRNFMEVSDGQRQRVLLARAICQEPEIILLDEPTSFLDVRHKIELLSILRQLAKEKGITVIMSLHEIDLAMKISDKIMCVKGEYIEQFGTPAEVFNEEVINELYDIKRGVFDPLLGSIEMPAPDGRPSILVISSGGSGIPVYRRLQKEGIPFAAGPLYTNDLDFHLAKELAAKVFEVEAFSELTETECERIIRFIDSDIDIVINAGVKIGRWNREIKKILDACRSKLAEGEIFMRGGEAVRMAGKQKG